jgi:hypothetical protein
MKWPSGVNLVFMFGSRSRSHEAPRQESLDGFVDAAVEAPLVPCTSLRGRWIVGEDGKLEMRWELDEPTPVTDLRHRRSLPSHGSTRRSA